MGLILDNGRALRGTTTTEEFVIGCFDVEMLLDVVLLLLLLFMKCDDIERGLLVNGRFGFGFAVIGRVCWVFLVFRKLIAVICGGSI